MELLALLLILTLTTVIAAGTLSRRTDTVGQGGIDFFSTPILIGALFLLLYVIKPLYLLGQGWYGPGILQNWKYDLDHYYFVITLSLVLIGMIAFGVGYCLLRNAVPAERTLVASVNRGRLLLFVLVSCAIGVGSVLYLVVDSGGILNFLLRVRARHSFYEDRGYFLLFLEFPKVAFLVYLALFLRGCGSWLVLMPAGMVVLLCDVAAGSRAAFLLGTFFPTVGLYHYLKRPLKMKHMALIMATFLFVFVAMRVATRDVSTHEILHKENLTQQRVELLGEALRNLPDYLLGNVEVGMFDSLLREVTGVAEGERYLLGQSLLRLVLVVPKALIGDLKPDRGNIVFTKTYYPGFYRTGHAGITASYIGDWFMNFGIVGVLAGMALLGALTRVIDNWRRSHATFGPLLYLVAMGQLVLVIRGDIQTLFNFAISVGLVMACILLIRRRFRTAPWNRGLAVMAQ